MPFVKAVKYGLPLKLAAHGAAGVGKTYTLLEIAKAIAAREGKPIALIDTENGSARLYADLFTFDTLELAPPFEPKRFIAAIKEAEQAGYGTLIIDSLTHAWSGVGGVLEMVDRLTAADKRHDSYAAWIKATPVQNALIEAILRSPLHLLVSLRAKQEYSRETVNGQTVIKKLGMEPIQRSGIDFEFTVFGRIDGDHVLHIEKSRCPLVADREFPFAGVEFANIVLDWLAGEEAPLLPAPASVSAIEEDASGPAQEQQLQSIRKLCAALGREEPAPNALTFNGAAALIRQFSREYNNARRAS